jgi:hypothetical protein
VTRNPYLTYPTQRAEGATELTLSHDVEEVRAPLHLERDLAGGQRGERGFGDEHGQRLVARQREIAKNLRAAALGSTKT